MEGLKETAFKSALKRMNSSRIVHKNPSSRLFSASKGRPAQTSNDFPQEQSSSQNQQQQPVLKITKMAKLILEALNEKPGPTYNAPKLPNKFDTSAVLEKKSMEIEKNFNESNSNLEKQKLEKEMFDFDTPVVKNNRKKKALILDDSVNMNVEESVPIFSFTDENEEMDISQIEQQSTNLSLPSFSFIDE